MLCPSRCWRGWFELTWIQNCERDKRSESLISHWEGVALCSSGGHWWPLHHVGNHHTEWIAGRYSSSSYCRWEWSVIKSNHQLTFRWDSEQAQMRLIIDFAKKALRQERGLLPLVLTPAQLASQSAGRLIYEQQPSIGYLWTHAPPPPPLTTRVPPQSTILMLEGGVGVGRRGDLTIWAMCSGIN